MKQTAKAERPASAELVGVRLASSFGAHEPGEEDATRAVARALLRARGRGLRDVQRESFRRTDLQRAAFDLGCKPDELKVVDVAEREVGVSGCGKRAVYVIAANGGWVNNSGVQAETK